MRPSAKHLATLALAACLLAGCKRNSPTGATTIQRTPRISGPTTQQLELAAQEDAMKELTHFDPLGDPTYIKTPDGEMWMKYTCGLMIQELRQPDGNLFPGFGQTVQVAYTGTFPVSNQVFDRSAPGKPLEFRVGSNSIIKGFSLAVSTMKFHQKRRVYLPPDLAYGSAGKPPSIPPNQPLIFEIELLSITGQSLDFDPFKIPKAEPAGPPSPNAPRVPDL